MFIIMSQSIRKIYTIKLTHVIIVSALSPNPLFSSSFRDFVGLGLGFWTQA